MPPLRMMRHVWNAWRVSRSGRYTLLGCVSVSLPCVPANNHRDGRNDQPVTTAAGSIGSTYVVQVVAGPGTRVI